MVKDFWIFFALWLIGSLLIGGYLGFLFAIAYKVAGWFL